MPAPRKYDEETRARAVRMYAERRREEAGESKLQTRGKVGELLGSTKPRCATGLSARRSTPAPVPG